jgi:purine-nucleoside phosphorylase
MGMNSILSHIQESVDVIRALTSQKPTVALVLGSGLGDFADNLPDAYTVAASDIPHYPASTVEGHRGRLVFSTLDSGLCTLAFQGRVHFYESGDLETVTYPIRLAHALGVHTLLVTNAAGAINREYSPGDLMLISDQLNFTWDKSLRTLADKTRTTGGDYEPDLRARAAMTAASFGLQLRSGVYAGVKGPSYETAAEVEMIRRAGGDVVGMSTVNEVHLATALGIRVLGISCITNKATGIGASKLNHQEVTEVANRVRHDFALLLNGILRTLG